MISEQPRQYRFDELPLLTGGATESSHRVHHCTRHALFDRSGNLHRRNTDVGRRSLESRAIALEETRE